MEKLKKRGRKPKGGKIMDAESILTPTDTAIFHNIILHLKCSSADIGTVNYHHHTVEPYDNIQLLTELNTYDDTNVPQKLKNMSIRLHTNDINKRSDCFWCAHPYNSSPVYIPKSKTDGQFQVYGSFCCPECAAGYLFLEKLDQSTRVERYQLLNDLYGDPTTCASPITPAPSPHYLLDKFYGTLTIEEYRQLIREKDKHITLVDKPVCCIYPEVIQNNVEHIKKGEYRLFRKKNS
jgi:hypothetical protein